MKISTRIATMAGATAIAASGFAVIATAADAATVSASASLTCHYNVRGVPTHYYLKVFKSRSTKSHVVGRLSRTAKRVSGQCASHKGAGGVSYIYVKASNGHKGYTGAQFLKKVK
jgi:hypothetical protein